MKNIILIAIFAMSFSCDRLLAHEFVDAELDDKDLSTELVDDFDNEGIGSYPDGSFFQNEDIPDGVLNDIKIRNDNLRKGSGHPDGKYSSKIIGNKPAKDSRIKIRNDRRVL